MDERDEQFEDAQNANANPPQEIQAITAKITLPEFWPQNIRVWFTQVEAQFLISGIRSDATKFNLLLTQLKPNVLTHVASIIENPPAQDKYTALKNRIIHVFADSEQHRIKTLLSGLQLGDRRPSHLLAEQQQIGGQLITVQMLKSLWINQLPSHIQAVVAAAPGSLNDLADIADKIWDIIPENHHVSAIQEKTRDDPSSTSLEDRLKELTLQVNALHSTRSRRDQSRDRYRRRSSPRSRSRSQDPDLCWYHSEFGQRAHKCAPNCKFFKKNKNSEN